ncbi:ABC transporter permease [Pasteurella multocida]|nr:ABC transporter permease [Pasteurella multocida]
MEKGHLELIVENILPETRFSRPAAFVDLETVVGIEDFRDGFQTDVFPAMSGQVREQTRETFARARIYAKQLDDVALLALKLRAKNIDTRTEAKAIENVKAIDAVLNVIFLVIAVTSIMGCILSLVGAFLANIDRKRKEIAVLRLLGFQSIGVMGFFDFTSSDFKQCGFFDVLLIFCCGKPIV